MHIHLLRPESNSAIYGETKASRRLGTITFRVISQNVLYRNNVTYKMQIGRRIIVNK